MLAIRDTAAGATFAVRVHPRAKKTAVTGIFGDGEDVAVKLSLSAPPVDGRANDAVVAYFAALFGVSRSSVKILTGETSRTKLVRVAGRSSAELRVALDGSLSR